MGMHELEAWKAQWLVYEKAVKLATLKTKSMESAIVNMSNETMQLF